MTGKANKVGRVAPRAPVRCEPVRRVPPAGHVPSPGIASLRFTARAERRRPTHRDLGNTSLTLPLIAPSPRPSPPSDGGEGVLPPQKGPCQDAPDFSDARHCIAAQVSFILPHATACA